MLARPQIKAFVPTTNAKAAKYFYRDILGLQLLSVDDFAVEFTGNGAIIRITVVDQFKPHPFTVLGFKIDDIVAQVQTLSNKGVEFERYEHFAQDEYGIWTAPSKAKVAWFKDPDGNVLSLTEYPK